MSTFEALTELDLPAADAERLRLPASRLQLRRSWPRSAAHLLLEYTCGDDITIAGQWLADDEELEHIARRTARAVENVEIRREGMAAGVAAVGSAINPGVRALLQAGGADRRLPGLATLVAQPDAQLLVHRPERRAVVRLATTDGAQYAKVVRPERVAGLTTIGRAVRELAGSAWRTPELLASDPESGVTIWSELTGAPLHDLFDDPRPAAAARATGAALRALHTATPSAGIQAHDAVDEANLLDEWISRTVPFFPGWQPSLATAAEPVRATLARDITAPALLHRDFYDKQVFVDADMSVGLLDFDTLAVGEAALDVANALVHFELRALQGGCSAEQAGTVGEAFLEGYAPSPAVGRRIAAYADATRLRLACVYLFRPRWHKLVPAVLDRLGQPLFEQLRVIPGFG